MRYLLLLGSLILLLAAACGDDDGGDIAGGQATEVPGVTGRLPGSLIGAVSDYISSEGLDGQTHELTDPPFCDELPAEANIPVGMICIAEGSTANGAAEVTVGLVQTDATWLLTLEEDENGEWGVVAVEYTGL
jgi:hypothetical protein